MSVHGYQLACFRFVKHCELDPFCAKYKVNVLNTEIAIMKTPLYSHPPPLVYDRELHKTS